MRKCLQRNQIREWPSSWASLWCGKVVWFHQSTRLPADHFPAFLSLVHTLGHLLWRSTLFSRLRSRSFPSYDFYLLYLMDTIWDEEKVNDKLENQSQSQISEIRCSHHALNIENSPLFLGMLDLSVYTNKKQRIRHTHTSHHATHFTMDVKWMQKGMKHFCPTTTLLPDRNYKKIYFIF